MQVDFNVLIQALDYKGNFDITLHSAQIKCIFNLLHSGNIIFANGYFF